MTLRRIPALRTEWWCCAASATALLMMANDALKHRRHHEPLFPGEMFHWMLMVIAMMVPFIAEPLGLTAFRSLRSRRYRAVSIFLAGYLATWAAAGVPVALLLAWLRRAGSIDMRIVAAGAFALATIWAMTPLRRRAFVACNRTMPLALDGVRADLDCLQFGGFVGLRCIATCLLLMIACALTGHALLAVIGGLGIGAIERLSFRVPVRAVLAGHLILAVVAYTIA
jgi:predicted metal-binding membrane protein